ncbi:hypothetical protein FQR65_LT17733 [Abscondita terminalis]|nr:hypothetical protein FQR65_LT17733 [Abscondita terminalis]
MYKHPDYENSGDFDTVVQVLNELFTPFFELFYRPIEPEDYKRLIDKPMSSITRFDVKKADEQMAALEEEIKTVKRNLRQLTEYAISLVRTTTKRMTLINDEPGSKLIILTNPLYRLSKLELLKGKSQTEEILEQSLTEIIDVKGIKAQGNRLSFHNIRKIELITPEEDLTLKKEKAANEAIPKLTERGKSDDPENVRHPRIKERYRSDIKLEINQSGDIQIAD